MEETKPTLEIDLDGPDGNAMVILGKTKAVLKKRWSY